jgi:signal transduction histidine kinase
VVVTVTGAPARADTVLDRVVREALTNALRHAPGAEVRLSFEELAGRTLLTIRNDAARSTPGPPGSGTGLSGIAARVHARGGDVHWQRTTDGGFELVVSLPCGQQVPA